MFAADGSEGSVKGVHAVTEKRYPGLAGGSERGGSSLKGNATLVEKGYAIADRQSLGHIMRYNKGREAEAALVFGDHRENGISSKRVETCGGFVEKHDLGLCNDRAGEGKTLLHTAGESPRIAIREIFHLKLVEGLEASLENFYFAERGRLLEWERDIFQRRERVKQRIALKKKAAAFPEILPRRRIAERAALEDNPPRVGRKDVPDALEEDGFPGSAWSKNGENTPTRHAKAHAFQNSVSVEALFQPLHLQREIRGLHFQIKNELIT